MPDQSIRGVKEWIDYICGCDIYEEVPNTDKNFHIGQFLKGHVKYPSALSTKVLELVNFDPENEMNSIFRIADYDPASAYQREWPIKKLNLRSTDRLFITPGKERTVILLKIIENVWMEDEIIKLALCLPIASFKSYMDRKLIVNIQLFELPKYFYIKPSEIGAREESVVRFDLIQYICLDHLRPVQNEKTSSNFRLSTIILAMLLNHLCRFLYDKPYDEALDQEIRAYRDIMKDDESIRKILAE